MKDFYPIFATLEIPFFFSLAKLFLYVLKWENAINCYVLVVKHYMWHFRAFVSIVSVFIDMP